MAQRLTSQQHAEARQLARDIESAVDAGDNALAFSLVVVPGDNPETRRRIRLLALRLVHLETLGRIFRRQIGTVPLRDAVLNEDLDEPLPVPPPPNPVIEEPPP